MLPPFWVGVLPPFFLCLYGFLFFIMSRWFKRTVVLDGSGFADNVKVDEIATKIVEFFGNENVCPFSLCPAVLSGSLLRMSHLRLML